MSIVEAVHVENKGIKILNAWFNYSQFSKLITGPELKIKLSSISKGDEVELVNPHKSYYDDIKILSTTIETKQSDLEVNPKFKGRELTVENLSEFKEKAGLAVALAGSIMTALQNITGKTDAGSFDETTAAIMKWCLWG